MLSAAYLDALPDVLIELYAQVESDILADMARRISTYDYYIPAAQWQHLKMQELGRVHDEILKQMSRITGKSQAEIRRLFKEAGAEALLSDDAIHKAAGKIPPPLNASPALIQTLNAGIKKTNGLFANLTKTTAKTATKQFENALDRAYMQITSGGFSTNTAVRSAVKELSKQGMGSITYPSGHTDNIEVAVRRATVTGVNQTAAELQLMRMDEMECDAVEVSAHGGARPEHAAWQGKQYSRSGRDKRFPPLSDTRYGYGDGLCGWNCRHSMYPFYAGISKPANTGTELARMEEKSITYNGVKMTEYEASQHQRYIERQMRRWKRENQAAKQTQDMDPSESAAKIKQWSKTEKDFCRQTGLKPQRDRTQIP